MTSVQGRQHSAPLPHARSLHVERLREGAPARTPHPSLLSGHLGNLSVSWKVPASTLALPLAQPLLVSSWSTLLGEPLSPHRPDTKSVTQLLRALLNQTSALVALRFLGCPAGTQDSCPGRAHLLRAIQSYFLPQNDWKMNPKLWGFQVFV